jgi:hypothetical protein
VQHHPVPMTFIGMNDKFGESGEPRQLMEKFGLTAEAIAQAGARLLSNKFEFLPANPASRRECARGDSYKCLQGS